MARGRSLSRRPVCVGRVAADVCAAVPGPLPLAPSRFPLPRPRYGIPGVGGGLVCRGKGSLFYRRFLRRRTHAGYLDVWEGEGAMVVSPSPPPPRPAGGPVCPTGPPTYPPAAMEFSRWGAPVCVATAAVVAGARLV